MFYDTRLDCMSRLMRTRLDSQRAFVVFAYAAVRFEFCFAVAGLASASVVLIGCLDSLAVSESAHYS
jgi:hypothetical protein